MNSEETPKKRGRKAAQMNLGDIEPDDDINNPEAMLAAAQAGDEDPADSPLGDDGSSDDLCDDEDEGL